MATRLYVRSFEAGGVGDRKALSLDDSLPRIRTALVRHGGPYAIKTERGDTSWSAERGLGDTMSRLRKVLPKVPVGEMVRVRCGKDGAVLRVYVVEARGPALPSTADRWHPLIRTAYQRVLSDPRIKGKVRYGGAESCRENRRVPGVWSMHSYWGPVLAIDFFVDEKWVGDIVHEILEDLGLVSIWWQELHYDHDHGQVGGNRDGTPECAR